MPSRVRPIPAQPVLADYDAMEARNFAVAERSLDIRNALTAEFGPVPLDV